MIPLLVALLATPVLDEQPHPVPQLWMPAFDLPQHLPVTTYRIPRASLERAKLEVKLVHLLHEDLRKEQSGVLDMELRRQIRRTEVQIEAAQ